MPLFKDKALYVQMVQKDQPVIGSATAAPAVSSAPPEWIDKAIKEQVTHVAVVAAGLMALKIILNTWSQVTINKSARKK